MKITRRLLADVMYSTFSRASSCLPNDVRQAFGKWLEDERVGETPRAHLTSTLENCNLAASRGSLACPDTGYPLWYIRVGPGIDIEGGLFALVAEAEEAVARVTKDSKLRKTIVNPLTRENPLTNVIGHLPQVDIKFVPDIDCLEMTAVPKGGGSEIFGTFYRMMVPLDGKTGIFKFVLDCATRAAESGKTCPPNIIGVGVGGTADLCMKLAKYAAVLRPVGSRHPDRHMSDMEESLLNAINALEIGPMGGGGFPTCLSLHVEWGGAHTAALPVAFNAQCSVARRATSRIHADGSVTETEYPDWFGREVV